MVNKMLSIFKMVFVGVESRYLASGELNKKVNIVIHGLCFFIALGLAPLYQPNVKIIGVTSGRGPGAGGDFLTILMVLFFSVCLYLARYRKDFRTKPSKSVVREYNIRSVSLLLLYGMFFFLMPVIHNYFHYGIVYLNPCELLVIDGR